MRARVFAMDGCDSLVIIMILEMNQRPGNKRRLAEYQINMDKVLGKGGFGCVYEAYDTKRNVKVAIKVLNKRKVMESQANINCLKNEVRLLKAAKSKHVVSYEDIILSQNNYYIVQELCNEDLKNYLKENGPLSEEAALDIFSQIICGFYHLIVHGIVHRDLKPENILFKDGVVKLADFGLAKKISSDSKLLETKVGTCRYQSPQVARGKKYTYKCDIWSLGAVLYELLNGKELFPSTINGVRKAHNEIQSLDLSDKRGSKEVKELILRCVQFEEEDRADWNYIFNHPLVKEKVPRIDQLEQNLAYIVSTLRTEIHSANINIKSLFAKFKKNGQEELRQESFCKMIVMLVGEDKISSDDMKYTFRYFDKDDNGKVSLDEFMRALEKGGVLLDGTFERGFSLQVKKTISESQDDFEDGNEEDAKEAAMTQKVYEKILGCLLEEKLEALKEKYDTEDLGDVGLNIDSFQECMKTIVPELSSEECRLLFRKFDDDRNGFITYNEFNKYICQVAGLPSRFTSHAFLDIFK